jgi:hypothetical protein
MSSVWRPRVLLFLFAAAVVVAVGCSGSGDRLEVSGNVKLMGEPIEDGVIQFAPHDKTLGSSNGAQIRKGEYKIPRGQGLKPGKYRVTITSGDPNVSLAPVTDDAAPGPSKRNPLAIDRIPEDWNLKSNHDVDITSSGPNKFDFDIDHLNPEYVKKVKDKKK